MTAPAMAPAAARVDAATVYGGGDTAVQARDGVAAAVSTARIGGPAARLDVPRVIDEG